jgi:adenylate kinase
MQESEKINTIKKWLGSGSINIFGRPFSGKDTQGRQLATLLGGTLIGGGEILRSDDMPIHIQQTMRTGMLIPSEDYIKIVLQNLSHRQLVGRPLILSSVGRWIGEESSVIKVTQASGHPIMAVIDLVIDEDIVRSRWQLARPIDDRGRRHDDAGELLEIRLREFKNKTEPVLEAYRKLGLVIEVDGSQTTEEVAQIIIAKLYDFV